VNNEDALDRILYEIAIERFLLMIMLCRFHHRVGRERPKAGFQGTDRNLKGFQRTRFRN
jgi:hypothetical protein